MIIGVDIGGSKTLVAGFEGLAADGRPQLTSKQRFPTDQDFARQYQQIVKLIHELCQTQSPTAIVVGSRGEIAADGSLTDLKLLGWRAVPLTAQLKADFNCPVELYSDAGLATLAEAQLGAGRNFNSVFYCTISSGIGTGLVKNGQLVLDRSGGGDLVVRSEHLDVASHDQTLERLMSGKAIARHFGHQATEITDPGTWQEIAAELALALNDFIVLTQPDIVIIGGSIGLAFGQYQDELMRNLEHYSTSQYPLPKIVSAELGEDSVIYGAALKAQELTS